MIKYRKLLLITLSVILALAVLGGIIILIAGLASNSGNDKTKPDTISILHYYTTIEIEETAGDVEVVFTSSGNSRIEAYKKGADGEEIFYVNTQGNTSTSTLKIFSVDNRKWYQKWFDNTLDLKVTVYLPSQEYKQIKIKTVSGDITINDKFNCETLKLSSVSGDISSKALASETLNVSTTSGDVDIYGDGLGDVNVTTTSGDISFNKVFAHLLYAKSVSGGISFFDYAQADQMRFETTSGNIAGKIVESKNIRVETTSGNVDVVKSFGGEPLLSMKTVSGNITVKYYGLEDVE